MNRTTQRDLIQGLPQRWREQYRHCAGEKRVITGKLDNLDVDVATPADVAEIIGNESWTRMTCGECKKDVTELVTIGDEPDYESQTASICIDCARKAASLFFKK